MPFAALPPVPPAARLRAVAVAAGAATTLWATALAAQTAGAEERSPVPLEMLLPAETERVFCTRRTTDEMLTVQRRGPGWYSAAWEGSFPTVWDVILEGSGRTITLGVEANWRPRRILAIAPRPAALGGGFETVQVRFLTNGDAQDGFRAVTTRRSSVEGGAVQRSELHESDGALAYTLARELAVRCERRLVDPLPLDAIWAMIPPT